MSLMHSVTTSHTQAQQVVMRVFHSTHEGVGHRLHEYLAILSPILQLLQHLKRRSIGILSFSLDSALLFATLQLHY
jgi:hypothetical protein